MITISKERIDETLMSMSVTAHHLEVGAELELYSVKPDILYTVDGPRPVDTLLFKSDYSIISIKMSTMLNTHNCKDFFVKVRGVEGVVEEVELAHKIRIVSSEDRHDDEGDVIYTTECYNDPSPNYQEMKASGVKVDIRSMTTKKVFTFEVLAAK